MKLFNEKNMEKITSPEQLSAYMKVTSVPLWVNLAAIMFLLLGICIWSMIGQLKTTITVNAQGSVNISKSEIDVIQANDIQIGDEILCNGKHGHVSKLTKQEDKVYIFGSFQEPLPEDLYCDITISSQSWFSLLFPIGKRL